MTSPSGGDFFQIADFIASLDSLVDVDADGPGVDGRLITVDGFALTPDPDKGFPRLNADLHVTTFVTPADQGGTAGATEAAPVARPRGVRGSTDHRARAGDEPVNLDPRKIKVGLPSLKRPGGTSSEPGFAANVYADLRARRLLIPLAAIAVAIVAVPVLLASDPDQAPAPCRRRRLPREPRR